MNPWDAQWSLSSEDAGRRIRAAFPELASEPVRFLSEGWDNHVFTCGSELLFRFPRRDVAVPLLWAEYRLLPLLQPHLPAPIPSARFWSDADDTGRPFAGVPFIAGETACRVPEERLEDVALARDLGAFLRSLHTIAVTGQVRKSILPDHFRRTNLPRRRALVEGDRPTLQRLLGSKLDRVFALLDVWQHSPVPERRTVVHGDLYARHVLVSESGRLAGIIDWGDVHLGCPALDLAVAWAVLPAPSRPAFFEAYGPVDAPHLRVARFRALFHACRTLSYAVDIADPHLEQASRRAIDAVLADPGPR
jgi:aminoglycoside phosphotransferase (APT) family kinase protein